MSASKTATLLALAALTTATLLLPTASAQINCIPESPLCSPTRALCPWLGQNQIGYCVDVEIVQGRGTYAAVDARTALGDAGGHRNDAGVIVGMTDVGPEPFAGACFASGLAPEGPTATFTADAEGDAGAGLPGATFGLEPSSERPSC